MILCRGKKPCDACIDKMTATEAIEHLSCNHELVTTSAVEDLIRSSSPICELVNNLRHNCSGKYMHFMFFGLSYIVDSFE